MRTRLIAVGVAVAAVLAGATVLVVAGRGGATLSSGQRDALIAAGAADDPGAAIDDLAASDDWPDLVAAGGSPLAALLDRGQGSLGTSTSREQRAAAVIAPWVDGETIDSAVLPALVRWAWPLLAADVRTGDARAAAARVLARADEGDDERDAIGPAVGLARIHRAITSPADGDDALSAWRSDLAAAAIVDLEGEADDRRSTLVDARFQDLPMDVALAALTTWGDADGTSVPVRALIAELAPEGETSAGSTLTVACYLAVIDDTADIDAARVAAELAREAEDVVRLEDDLLSSDDPALAPVGDPATLLLSA